ncbi:hypothetical protein ACJX0J_023668, partial [Zea mays]
PIFIAIEEGVTKKIQNDQTKHDIIKTTLNFFLQGEHDKEMNNTKLQRFPAILLGSGKIKFSPNS